MQAIFLFKIFPNVYVITSYACDQDYLILKILIKYLSDLIIIYKLTISLYK